MPLSVRALTDVFATSKAPDTDALVLPREAARAWANREGSPRGIVCGGSVVASGRPEAAWFSICAHTLGRRVDDRHGVPGSMVSIQAIGTASLCDSSGTVPLLRDPSLTGEEELLDLLRSSLKRPVPLRVQIDDRLV